MRNFHFTEKADAELRRVIHVKPNDSPGAVLTSVDGPCTAKEGNGVPQARNNDGKYLLLEIIWSCLQQML